MSEQFVLDILNLKKHNEIYDRVVVCIEGGYFTELKVCDSVELAEMYMLGYNDGCEVSSADDSSAGILSKITIDSEFSNIEDLTVGLKACIDALMC
jgi:hypothetical protein